MGLVLEITGLKTVSPLAMEALRASVAETQQEIRNLSEKWMDLDEIVQNISSNMSRNNSEVNDTLKEILTEIRSGRVECQSNYQNLASKWSDNSNGGVFVVEEGGIVHMSQSSGGQIFTIPTLSSSSEPDAKTQTYPASQIPCRRNSTGGFQPTAASRDNLSQLVEAVSLREERVKKLSGELSVLSSSKVIDDDQSPTRISQLSPESNGTFTRKSGKKTNKRKNSKQSNAASSSEEKNCQSRTDESVIALNTLNNPTKPNSVERDRANGKLFACPYCPRKFEHNHSVALHIRSCKKKHDTLLQKLGIFPKTTPTCSNDWDIEIQSQKKDDSVEVMNRDLGGTVSTLPILNRKSEKMIKCGYCERTFPTHHQVSSHERVHTGVRPFSCYVCRIKFAHGGNMIKHIKNKHPGKNPYGCYYCQRNFKTQADAQHHRKECKPPRTSRSKTVRSIGGPAIRKSGRESEETSTASEGDENSRDEHVFQMQEMKIEESTPEVKSGHAFSQLKTEIRGRWGTPKGPHLFIPRETPASTDASDKSGTSVNCVRDIKMEPD